MKTGLNRSLISPPMAKPRSKPYSGLVSLPSQEHSVVEFGLIRNTSNGPPVSTLSLWHLPESSASPLRPILELTCFETSQVSSSAPTSSLGKHWYNLLENLPKLFMSQPQTYSTLCLHLPSAPTSLAPSL